MLGPLDYLLWFAGPAIQAYVVFLAVRRKDFVRYLPLNFYMLSVALLSVSRFIVYRSYGFRSDAYLYFYYYSDTLLTIFLYFGILGLYQKVFEEMRVSRYVRGGGNILLALTAVVSFLMVHENEQNMTSRFVVELSQNLYFVGVMLTYLLWGAVLQLRETRMRIVQLVLSLGVFFSAHAAVYAARHLFPDYAPWISWAPAMLGLILPLSWAYTFSMVSEDARLVPARVGAPHAAAQHVVAAHR